MQRDGIISAVPPNLVNPAHQAFIGAKAAASSAAPRGWDEKPCFSHSPHRQYIIITIIYQTFCVNIHGQEFHKFNCFCDISNADLPTMISSASGTNGPASLAAMKDSLSYPPSSKTCLVGI